MCLGEIQDHGVVGEKVSTEVQLVHDRVPKQQPFCVGYTGSALG